MHEHNNIALSHDIRFSLLRIHMLHRRLILIIPNTPNIHHLTHQQRILRLGKFTPLPPFFRIILIFDTYKNRR